MCGLYMETPDVNRQISCYLLDSPVRAAETEKQYPVKRSLKDLYKEKL